MRRRSRRAVLAPSSTARWTCHLIARAARRLHANWCPVSFFAGTRLFQQTLARAQDSGWFEWFVTQPGASDRKVRLPHLLAAPGITLLILNVGCDWPFETRLAQTAYSSCSE